MRIFLDANILFSGANEASNLHRFILLLAQTHSLISSEYAHQEALRNILAKRPQWEGGYQTVIPRITLVAGTDRELAVRIPEKDRPILATAITEKCDVLITGDRRHFGRLFNRTIDGVTVLTPLMFARKLIDNASERL